MAGRLATAAAVLAGLAGPAAAHPHIFVETGIELIFDAEGRLAALRIDWAYDELFSLLLIEDGAHDRNGDGEIDAGELEGLHGFDMDWGEDFEGDLDVRQGGRLLPLTRPVEFGTGWSGGKLTSSHLRRFETPVEMEAGAVVIRPFDPGYYSAYEIVGTPRLTGREDCLAELRRPDLGAAQRELQAALAELSADMDAEELGFPEVGEAFAEELRMTCGG